MQIAIQVLKDDGTPASQTYTFGQGLTHAHALMLVQSLLALSGGYDDLQREQVAMERACVDMAQILNVQAVRIVRAR